ncbi:MAG: cytochrome c3 family protein [Candidatus Omnitrophica bacterium]|nr:cytochrome c3 family protein [Candidatus Omnitrophota bacterium]
MNHFTFPKWVNYARPAIAILLIIGPLYAVSLAYYGGSPRTTDVGYQPKQPVPYSHALHAGELGIDCRYCHNTVEESAQASIPPTQTCMNCHKLIRAESEKLLPIRESYATGMPVEWVRVHDLPDYVYFNHSAHVTRGVGCVSCHGRVDKMEEVHQVETLSMSWCLDCHRNPEKHLRPLEAVTQLDWRPDEEQEILGVELKRKNNINPSTDCSTCHR